MAEHAQPSQPPEPADMLAQLAAKAMLSFDARTGRYELPAEVASFVREAGAQADRHAGIARLIEWARSWSRDAALAERTDREQRVLEEFVTARPHLECAAGLEAGVVDAACWVWIRSGRAGVLAPRATGDARQRLLAAAEGQGACPSAVDGEIRHLDADIAAGELAQAWSRAEGLLAQRRSVGDRVGEAEVSVRVALLALERERYAAAIRLAQQAVALAGQGLAIVARARLVEARAALALGQRSPAASALHDAFGIASAGRLAFVARGVLVELIAMAEHAEPRRALEWRRALEAGGEELWAKAEQADGWARARRS